MERVIAVAEAVDRGIKLVKALRKDGNGEVAAVIEKECTRLAKQIVSRAKGRRRNGIRARSQQRNSNGRFT